MGRIDSIVLENFKSYGGHHRLGPFENFTCIIGPNGSGKSNVMDAISFVLGVKAVKLRVAAFSDLIHKKDNVTAADYASVKLVYTQHAGDRKYNSSSNNAAELEDEDDETDDVDDSTDDAYNHSNDLKHSSSSKNHAVFDTDNTMTFTRRIDQQHKKGGSSNAVNTTTYLFNDVVVSAEFYQQQLLSVNINMKHPHFLVFQGDIRDVAHKSPSEFTTMFEHISGSHALIASYQQAFARAMATEQQFSQIFEKRKSMIREQRGMRGQKEEAEKYQQLLLNIAAMKREFALLQLYFLDTDIASLKAQKQTQQQQKKHQEQLVAAAIVAVEDASSAVAAFTRQQQQQKKQHAKQQAVIDKHQPTQIRAHEQLLFTQAKLKQHQESLQKLQKQQKLRQATRAELEQQLKQATASLADLQALFDSADGADLQQQQQQLQAYNALQANVGAATAALQERYTMLERLYQSSESQCQRKEQSIKLLTQREQQLKAKLQQQQSELQRYQQLQQDRTSTLNSNQSMLAQLQQQHEEQSSRRTQLQHELTIVTTALAASRNDREHSRHTQQLLTVISNLQTMYNSSSSSVTVSVGSDASTITTAAAAGGVVFGRLSDLLQASHNKYRLAVAVALSHHNNDVVVDNIRTATDCITYMKESRSGIATFIPLATIKTTPITQQQRQQLADNSSSSSGSVSSARFAIEAVQFEEQYERAVQHALGNTIIVDTVAEARALLAAYARSNSNSSSGSRYNGKIVCLDGTVMHKNGNISGGTGRIRVSNISTASSGSGIITTDQQHQQAKLKQQKLQQELTMVDAIVVGATGVADGSNSGSSAVKQMVRLHADITALRETLMSISSTIAHTQTIVQQTQQEQSDAQQAINTASTELTALRQQQQGKQQVVRDALKAVNAAAEGVYADFNASVGVDNIEQYQQQQLLLAQQQQEQFVQYRATIDRSAQSLEEEKRTIADITSSVKKLETAIASDRASIAVHAAEEATVSAQVAAAVASQELINEQLQATTTALTNAGVTHKVQKHSHHTATAALDASARVVVVTAQAVTSLQQQRQELMQKCRIELIDVPLLSEEDVAKQSKKRKQQLQKSKKATKGQQQQHDDESDEEDELEDEEENDAPETAVIHIDYSELTEHLDARSASQRDKVKREYEQTFHGLQQQLSAATHHHNNPNFRSSEQLEAIRRELVDIEQQYHSITTEHKQAQQQFDAIHSRRARLFDRCFTTIKNAIEDIYANLTKSPEFRKSKQR